MSKLKLSVAIGNYDRARPLFDGAVQIDGVDPVFMTLPPEEIFFRAFRTMDFDICELSMSSFTVKTAEGTCPYVGVPAFVSRAFRHNSIYVRTDRIRTPAGSLIVIFSGRLGSSMPPRTQVTSDGLMPWSSSRMIRAQTQAVS